MSDPAAQARAESDSTETDSESQVAPGTTGSTDDVEAVDAGPGFMNRAARRAHAQGTTPRRSFGTQGQFGRKGTVQGPRQWGNRRSG